MRNPCTVQASWFALIVVPLLLAAAPAAAQGTSEKTPPRTVSWFADHQQERARVQLACIDDPGHKANDPDCINAQEASVEAALRLARAHTGTLNPRDPAFWSADPQTRRNKLLMCRLNSQLDYCDVAKRSLLIEAGQAKR